MLSKWMIACACFLIGTSGFSQDLLGDWYGELNAGGASLEIVFHISKEGDKLEATFDSPAQNVAGVAADTVMINGNELEISIGKGAAVYKGTYSEDDGFLRGTFSQGGFAFPMSMAHQKGMAPKMRRPQEPIAPFPYQTQDVTFENKKAGINLAGTITTSGGDKKYPAIILISGSGPQDRNSEILGHKPFLVLADRFTRSGYTVLRFDERGVGKSEGMYPGATSNDFANDVEAAIEFLRKHPNVDKKRIVLVGHSEGGLIAPMVAARNKHVAAVVMLAGSAVRGDEIIIDQARRIGVAEGATEAEGDLIAKQMREQLSILIDTEDKETRNTKLRAHFDALYETMTEKEKAVYPNKQVFITSAMAGMMSPWYINFVKHDPLPDLLKVKCPLMAVYGSKDLQVAPELNVPVLEKIKKENWKIEVRDNLNHLFQPCETGGVSEYGMIETTFDMQTVGAVVEWLNGLWP